ncbi:hypothetical protein GQ53DRAFT_835370 [Thozetella sp. PMI_491]|nr:hypothetical protein GQ53DRAFT_835370 [Thozetella sp. PMI_491]
MAAKYTKIPIDNDEESLPNLTPYRGSKIVGFLRLGLEVFLLFAVVILLKQNLSYRLTIQNDSRWGSHIPNTTFREVRFTPDNIYTSYDMLVDKDFDDEVLRHWTDLSPHNHGLVYIDPSERQGLPKPYNLSWMVNKYNSDAPSEVYVVSVFHQLHCLSMMIDQIGRFSSPGGWELSNRSRHHTIHCFDYLRQAILCAGDTTLEGTTVYGEGWGSLHQCKDIDTIRQSVEIMPGIPVGDWSEYL